MPALLEIDGHHLTLEDTERVARGEVTEVRLAASAKGALHSARRLVEDRIAQGVPVYGVTSGFGRLADMVIPPEQRIALQRNVIISHASGAGSPIDRPATRALMLLRANTLAHGHSGCSPRTVELLLECLNAGIHPVVPEFGSVGASGDLVPLAHVALALIGEGQVEYGGRIVAAADAQGDASLRPFLGRATFEAPHTRRSKTQAPFHDRALPHVLSVAPADVAPDDGGSGVVPDL